nr:hypothetical protein [Saprospiraceae bacterium]
MNNTSLCNFFILAVCLAVCLSGCTNYLKMMERGEFDMVFYRSLDKMEGKKNKREKDVLAAEEAFARANARDMGRIEALQGRTDEQSLNEMLRLTERIERRQSRLQPFLPLRDKKGYTAHFELVNPHEYADEAARNLYGIYLQEANLLMERGEKGDKIAARRAHDLYLKAESLIPGTVEVKHGLEDSKYFGTSRVYMQVVNRTNKVLPSGLEETLTNINFSEFRNTWQEFSSRSRQNDDYLMEIELSDIQLSPERIVERQYELKEVVEKKNSSDTTTTTETVYATVTEFTLQKSAVINANVLIKDLRDDKIVHREPVFSTYQFENVVNSYQGDLRAIPKKLPIGGSLNFPLESEMIYKAGENLKDRIIDYVSKFDL